MSIDGEVESSEVGFEAGVGAAVPTKSAEDSPIEQPEGDALVADEQPNAKEKEEPESLDLEIPGIQEAGQADQQDQETDALVKKIPDKTGSTLISTLEAGSASQPSFSPDQIHQFEQQIDEGNLPDVVRTIREIALKNEKLEKDASAAGLYEESITNEQVLSFLKKMSAENIKTEVSAEALAVVNEIIKQRAAEIRDLLKSDVPEIVKSAIERLKSLVPPDELRQRLIDAGMNEDSIDEDQVEDFLRGNIDKQTLIRDIVLYFHIQKNRRKSREQSAKNNSETPSEQQEQDSVQGSTNREYALDEDGGRWDAITDWTDLAQEHIGEIETFLDEDVDVRRLIEAMFAIESRGVGSSSALRGIEKKDEEKEQTTMNALKRIFAKKEPTETFFFALIDEPKDSGINIIPKKLDELLLIPDGSSEDDRTKLIGEIKNSLERAFLACHEENSLLPKVEAKNINLSESVMQFILDTSEKLVTSASKS